MAGVRVTGLREAIRSLERLGVSVQDLKAAFGAIGNKVVSDAQSLAPVKSGKLASSIKASKTKNKSVIRAGSKAINYASFVEFGSVHNTAQHMIETAIKDNDEWAAEQLDKELQSLIRKYGLA